MSDFLVLRQIIGSEEWISAVVIGGIFMVLCFRRESIISYGLFRLGTILFVLSLLIQPLILPLATFISGDELKYRLQFGSANFSAVYLLIHASGPILQAMAIYCIISSMFPAKARKPEPIRVPQKHPLDD